MVWRAYTSTAQDLLILQEIIYKTKPDFFIEVGVAWSGSLLFYSSIFNNIGGKKLLELILIYLEKYIKISQNLKN